MTEYYTGEIELDSPIDIPSTLKSGQTFLWNKLNGEFFEDEEDEVFYTNRLVDDDKVHIRIFQDSKNHIMWESNNQIAEDKIKSIFQVGELDYPSINNKLINLDSKDGIIKNSIKDNQGLRIVNEPLFPTLISFICSTQMRVERIHKMVWSLMQEYGEEFDYKDGTQNIFPSPQELANLKENELKELKLGYRSRYVIETSQMFSDEQIETDVSNEQLRTQLNNYMGVGTKVADCVMLYGFNKIDVVPVDTWIDTVVKEYYPSLEGDSREDMARNLEGHFGDYAGVAQLYLFHYIRTQD